MKYRDFNLRVRIPWPEGNINISKKHLIHWLLPTPGNVLFVLVVITGLFYAQSVGALPFKAPQASGASTGTIAYQGRLADADGNPLTGTYNMEFRLYDVPEGGVPLWEELWTGSNAVRVSDGLFNVMLGSLNPIPMGVVTGHDTLYLGITVGTDDEMTPRVQLGSVPWAVQPLTVPDGSITTEKIADGAVTQAKAPFTAKVYWGLGSTISSPGDMKALAITTVVNLQGGESAEAFFYDVSSLNFLERPHAICQLVNTTVSATTDFCHCDWDGSTNETLKFWIRRYDGGTLSSGLRRVNIILFGR